MRESAAHRYNQPTPLCSLCLSVLSPAPGPRLPEGAIDPGTGEQITLCSFLYGYINLGDGYSVGRQGERTSKGAQVDTELKRTLSEEPAAVT